MMLHMSRIQSTSKVAARLLHTSPSCERCSLRRTHEIALAVLIYGLEHAPLRWRQRTLGGGHGSLPWRHG